MAIHSWILFYHYNLESAKSMGWKLLTRFVKPCSWLVIQSMSHRPGLWMRASERSDISKYQVIHEEYLWPMKDNMTHRLSRRFEFQQKENLEYLEGNPRPVGRLVGPYIVCG